MNTCDKCGCDIVIDEEYWDDREYERIGRDVNWVIPIPCYCRACYFGIVKEGKRLGGSACRFIRGIWKVLDEEVGRW
jgi:hypothetical protein